MPGDQVTLRHNWATQILWLQYFSLVQVVNDRQINFGTSLQILVFNENIDISTITFLFILEFLVQQGSQQ
jgi:hypothetical protein